MSFPEFLLFVKAEKVKKERRQEREKVRRGISKRTVKNKKAAK